MPHRDLASVELWFRPGTHGDQECCDSTLRKRQATSPEAIKPLVRELLSFSGSLKDNLATCYSEHKHYADLDPGI